MTTPIEVYARRQARTKRAAEAVSYVNGITTEAPASGWVRVDIGGAVRKAKVPGSFRSEVKADQAVRLSRQQNTLIVDSILDALPAPTVSAAPANGQTNASTSGHVFDGMYLYLYTDVAGVAGYAWDIAEVVNWHGGDLNTLRGKYDELVGKYNDLAGKYNTLKNTVVAEVLAALRDQGRIT